MHYPDKNLSMKRRREKIYEKRKDETPPSEFPLVGDLCAIGNLPYRHVCGFRISLWSALRLKEERGDCMVDDTCNYDQNDDTEHKGYAYEV